MSRNFYYRSNAEIVSGAANFAALLVAEAATLGVSPAQATAFGVFNTDLQAAWTASETPATRGPVSIEARNVAIRNLRTQAIGLAKLIYANPAVDDAKLMELGLLPRTSPAPVPPTMTPPELEISSVSGRLVSGRVRQAAPVEGKARPDGSVGAQIYTFVGASAPSDPNLYTYQGLASRNKFEVLFGNDVASGATAWIAAAWVSRRGERGFACTPVQVTIQGGPVLAEAA